MRKLILAATILAGVPFTAGATQIISFGQTSTSNTVTATDNSTGPGTATQTTIVISDATVLIDQLFGVTTPPAIGAFVDLTATSIDAATGIGPALLQHYSGTFSITSGAGDTGTDYLSGTFSDAAFGLATGTQLSVNVANPPDTLNLASDVIPAADLIAPSSFTLALSNLLPTPPGLSLDNTTIAPFTASFAGTANATTVNTPEPASLLILGAGLLGLAWVRRRTS